MMLNMLSFILQVILKGMTKNKFLLIKQVQEQYFQRLSVALLLVTVDTNLIWIFLTHWTRIPLSTGV